MSDFLCSNWKAITPNHGKIEVEIRGDSVRVNIANEWHQLGLVKRDPYFQMQRSYTLGVTFVWDEESQSIKPHR